MNQNNNISEEEKIKLVKSTFAKFKAKINELLKRQSNVFKNIMERINKRKLEEQRKKLDEVFEDKD
jgi:transcription antitermination factor NusG